MTIVIVEEHGAESEKLEKGGGGGLMGSNSAVCETT